jgi:type IX secretion system PorP/SprF family membrane protein
MSYSKSVIYCFVFFLFSGVSLAQQVPMYSQYVMNGFLLNPSLAGRDGYVTANLTVREQWLGIKSAPSTYAASFQTSLLQNSFMTRSVSVRKKRVKPTRGSNVGVGGYIFNDDNGIMRRTGIQAAYAYHIPVGKVRRGGAYDNLSFGLALIAYQYAVNTNQSLFLISISECITQHRPSIPDLQ